MATKEHIKKIYSVFFEPEFPADLALIVLWLAVSIVVSNLPVVNQTPVTSIFVLPSIVFIPGYCFLVALFPKNDDIGFSERIALSFGLSIIIIAPVALVLYLTLGEIQIGPILLLVSLISWVMILVAHYRRAMLPVEKRFVFPFSDIASVFKEIVYPAGVSTVDRLLSWILVLVIIVAISTTIYVIASPKEHEHFSEFFILGENKMAADYPDQIIPGLRYPMYIGVGNHEYSNVTYNLETWAASTQFDNVTNSTTILLMDPLDHMQLTLPHNETTIIPYTLSLNKTRYNRIEFLLFNESIPGFDVKGSDRVNASYRDLYLRVTVKGGEEQESVNPTTDG